MRKLAALYMEAASWLSYKCTMGSIPVMNGQIIRSVGPFLHFWNNCMIQYQLVQAAQHGECFLLNKLYDNKFCIKTKALLETFYFCTRIY